MALYKPSHSSVYQTRFQVKGKMFRKSTGETDVNKARKFETEFRRECRLAVLNKAKQPIKAHKALDAFLETKKDSDNFKNYKKHVDVCKKFFFSQQYLHDVTFDQLEKLAEQETEAGYANATVNHRLQTFSSAITLARKRGFKVPDLTIPKLKTTKGRTRVLTDEEFESIKIQLRDMTVFKSDKYRATPQAAFRQDAADIVELLSGTGARRAEVTTLEWPQINLKTKTIHLYRSKTDNEMVFHMTDDAYELLVRRSENKRHPLYVFPNRKGNGPRRSPGSSIKKAIARAGLGPEVTPHVFRHSVATKLLNGGMPITQVQYFLGHKDPMTTHRYLHTSKQASSVAAAAILSGA